eukprot:5250610-Pyramimonas_sp.AAC.1
MKAEAAAAKAQAAAQCEHSESLLNEATLQTEELTHRLNEALEAAEHERGKLIQARSYSVITN